MNPVNYSGWLLIVEDQADQWVVLRHFLKHTLPGIEMVNAVSKPAAITCLHDCSRERGLLPRLILQDLHLPEREEGISLLSLLKEAASPYRHLPVIVMSSSDDPVNINETYGLGANSYLIKPVNRDEWSRFTEQIRQYWWETTVLPPGKSN